MEVVLGASFIVLLNDLRRLDKRLSDACTATSSKSWGGGERLVIDIELCFLLLVLIDRSDTLPVLLAVVYC